MTYSFFDFLQLIGALGIFIFGMKIFSDGLQKVAGSRLRSILKGMTTSRFRGLLTGFGVTSITQSSSTTTVMVVSFVNAGLITLLESTGVIMGANIGTTVTAWMVSIFGFKMSITPVAISMIGLFFPFMFFGKKKLQNLAEAMIGFGILFIGLEFIKSGVPNIQENPEMFAMLDSFTEFGFLSIVLFVIIGTALTLVTQSSSAAMAITLVMLFEGWINFPIAAAMILGENIGTTVTANLAAIVGNVHAKRAARFHFIFNAFGVVWMLFLIHPFLNGIDFTMQYFDPTAGSIFGDSQAARASATLGLSLFHTVFNVVNVILLIGFVPQIVSFVERMQKADKSDMAFRLQYISSGMMSSPELSIAQAHKEIELFGKLIEKIHYSFSGLFFRKQKKQEKFLKKIEKREQITDNIELEVSDYLTKISSDTLSDEATIRIRSMHSMINDLERIGDLYFQMSKTFEDMMELEVALPKEAVMEVSDYLDTVLKAIKLMRKNMENVNGELNVDLEAAIELENKINETRDEMKDAHYRRLEQGIYTSQAGVIFLDYITRLEKIGDHIFNIQEALAGKKLKTHSEMLVGR
ncbi:Na/Pi cotransporter family protein [Rhodohalobacter sulfatireducens]|uniref:Na/Pi cotransporter family protein n=1 Tax=Rhodohalobacter sulfatireducens TaxID=2911366 RepID=A0ABS9KHF3_9BACT|nr:Na/Pi cotransporter family protein [Rhodohalobacter sulfatireducens]MCG2590271.1 Na/Pi cotransporter family protein [Rhodohalobacter sulfatireducens]